MIAALRARIAVPPAAREFGRRLFDNRTTWAAIEDVEGETDPMAVEGAMPAPTPFPTWRSIMCRCASACRAGRMRGNAHGYTASCVESFVDEVAQRHGARTAELPHRDARRQDPRLAECLQRAARLGEWGGGARRHRAGHRLPPDGRCR